MNKDVKFIKQYSVVVFNRSSLKISLFKCFIPGMSTDD